MLKAVRAVRARQCGKNVGKMLNNVSIDGLRARFTVDLYDMIKLWKISMN